MSKKGNFKIIFVNSFKGGAGKTTLSLAQCVSGLFKKEGTYDNVIYFDLDVLGTATSYLFEEEKLPPEKSFPFSQEPVRVRLCLEEAEKTLYVCYLSPEFKNRGSFGEKHFVNHQEIARQKFLRQVLDFIEARQKEEISTLLVFDCAPGFSEWEQELLTECYQKKGIAVEEDYVTTLDARHVEKCVQCLKESRTGIGIDLAGRSIKLILCDVQNYAGYVSDRAGQDGKEEFLRMGKRLHEKLKDLDEGGLGLFLWKYSREIAFRTIWGNQESVENLIDHYLMTDDNYMELLCE